MGCNCGNNKCDSLTVGFVGLGRMGGNMVKRMLASKKIKVYVQNRGKEAVDQAVALGAVATESIEDMIAKLPSPKIVWLMLPSGEITENAFQKALGLLKTGDVLVDGGNSNFHDTLRRHKLASERGIKMADVGVSGGIVAADTGYPMMIGGDPSTYAIVKPILDTFGIQGGFDLVGPGGAGHYVKMIHNAIEYGMMQALGEGFDLLENGRIKGLDLEKVSGIWNHGTIVSSFLLKMVHQALQKDKKLTYLKPYIEDSGEGKWSAIEALEHDVPFVVNSYALHARYISRDDDSFAFKLVAAMRNEFGGHAIKK